jgi:plasmid stability protein
MFIVLAPRVRGRHNETTLVAIWCKNMPTTLTLKNIPDSVYERLKSAAEMHRRSLNSEAIVCLESVLRIGTPNIEERLTQIRALRASLGKTKFAASDIDKFKRQGRA